MFQDGLPDIYATHKLYGPRWIEVKNPNGYVFTKAQKRDFPKFCANGSPIWILVSDSDEEIRKLRGPSNLLQYMKV